MRHSRALSIARAYKRGARAVWRYISCVSHMLARARRYLPSRAAIASADSHRRCASGASACAYSSNARATLPRADRAPARYLTWFSFAAPSTIARRARAHLYIWYRINNSAASRAARIISCMLAYLAAPYMHKTSNVEESIRRSAYRAPHAGI